MTHYEMFKANPYSSVGSQFVSVHIDCKFCMGEFCCVISERPVEIGQVSSTCERRIFIITIKFETAIANIAINLIIHLVIGPIP